MNRGSSAAWSPGRARSISSNVESRFPVGSAAMRLLPTCIPRERRILHRKAKLRRSAAALSRRSASSVLWVRSGACVLTRRMLTACTTIAIAGLGATCDDSPSPTAPLPTDPGRVGQFRLELRGPVTVPPDGTAQFNLVIIEGGGATRDVSAEAQWHVTNPAVLTVSTTGLVTGRNRGEAILSASINGFGANRPVMVIPDGTFRLGGNDHRRRQPRRRRETGGSERDGPWARDDERFVRPIQASTACWETR